MFGNTIISKLEAEISKKPSVIGLVLVGSYAREKIYSANEYSDMEVYVIVLDGNVSKVEKDLIEIAKQLGEIIFHYKNRWAGFSVVFDNLFRLELPVIKQSDIKSVFLRPIAQPVKILIDKTNGELKKALDTRQKEIDIESLFQETFFDFWYMAVLAVQYLKKGEYWNARHAQEVVLVPALIKLFEILDNKEALMLETNKRIEQFLSEERLNVLKKISSVYNSDNIKDVLKISMGEFVSVCNEIKKKYGFRYEEDVVDKVKPKLDKLLGS
ncbi:hypothetical protein A2697_04975 [Candidatus Curtissbacteria bacterium RIFCSPHIGHO2_01_FULL_41_44]|nr:MAG: hypothetical protein A3C33_05040 [Candidatus Curtissbacteria bacterium RIFCSPHIGHO2_02_FULL_42_58]OGD94672.1 MAG: hypothetical protein A2697_04975 [Candidatus Curtissbacteria bacterium RIFCSPHIGHO2_01_FULL_41_44]OGE02583.1 MAG: hypothetical protein A3G16_03595 [Candidatus Curtissbacteria bacterium RIFCSPLOWO2_12_FULL_41_16]OGE09631.1 MAG: hypothetical protein A3H87_00315 [Candidatus Curtissbacteria bacterium RIFCSPLOWO2_02_FULL_42_37]